jgi:serine protease AprX
MASINIFHAVILIGFLSLSATAQENRYMVFFTDKEGVAYSTSNPIEFLSEKAIARRLSQGVDISEQDLPVNASYVAAVGEVGVDVFFTTRWLNGVLIQCEPDVLPDVQSLPFVDRVELVAPFPQLQSGRRRSLNLRRKSNHTGVETQNQLRMIGIDAMHAAGYGGEGVAIAVFDSGFPDVNNVPAFQHIFSDDRFAPTLSYDFVHNSEDVFQYDDHGTEVLSVIAGLIPDAFTGGAHDASFQLYITEDVPTEYRIEEYNWLFAAERADSAGVDIIHTSLGYYDFDDASMNYTLAQMDGKTAVVSRAAQWAADRGILVVASAGNEGAIPSWGIITAPADARDVLAVGAVNSSLQKTGSSSIGPTADNRIKPDLAALGASVKVVKSNGVISTSSGTSLAAPLITSLAAGIMQRYPDLTNLEVMALMKQTASQAKNPDNLLGFGIPNFQAVVNFQERTVQTRSFEIYPNPLKRDTLTISPFDPDIVRSCEIEIVSAQGQVLGRDTAQFDWLNRNYKANLSGLASGVYYIRVFHEKRRHTFRLVRL